MATATSRKHRFVPGADHRLETRLVLHAATTHPGVSVVVSGLYPGRQALSRTHQPVVAEVNQAFDSFVSDYGQARAAYLESIQGNSSPTADTMNAFMLYTRGRVALLGQQVFSSFIESPLGTSKTRNLPTTVQTFVMRRLIDPVTQAVPVGSLADTLEKSTPTPGSSAATASLDTLAQDSAIESARDAVINGVSLIKSLNTGHQSHH